MYNNCKFFFAGFRLKSSSHFEMEGNLKNLRNVKILPPFRRIKERSFLFGFTNNTNVQKNCGFSWYMRQGIYVSNIILRLMWIVTDYILKLGIIKVPVEGSVILLCVPENGFQRFYSYLWISLRLLLYSEKTRTCQFQWVWLKGRISRRGLKACKRGRSFCERKWTK